MGNQNFGTMNEVHNKLVVFQEKEIRRVWHNEELWFVIADVVEALTESKNITQYIKDMRRRDAELSKGWGANCYPPFSANFRWKAEIKLCQHRRDFPNHPVHPFPLKPNPSNSGWQRLATSG